MYSFNKYEVEVSYLILQTELKMINKNFQTEFDCMNFLFSVYGTGYKWNDGEIIYPLNDFHVASGYNKIKESVNHVLSNLTLETLNDFFDMCISRGLIVKYEDTFMVSIELKLALLYYLRAILVGEEITVSKKCTTCTGKTNKF